MVDRGKGAAENVSGEAVNGRSNIATRSAIFYDQIASTYDRQLSTPSDLWIRAAFHEFVRARVPLGSTLLDFGCGTGLDAEWYAAQGYRVLAYDNSPCMIDRLRERCTAAVMEGRIDAWSDTYASFAEGLGKHGRFHGVTANFAVVNHLPDVESWFDVLAGHLEPGASVIISALNPCHGPALFRSPFWKRVVRYGGELGCPFDSGGPPHERYWPWRLHRLARGFRFASHAGAGALIGYESEPLDWAHPRSVRERLEHLSWQSWPAWLFGRFAFTELRRWD